jgi:hypothetical protein
MTPNPSAPTQSIMTVAHPSSRRSGRAGVNHLATGHGADGSRFGRAADATFQYWSDEMTSEPAMVLRAHQTGIPIDPRRHWDSAPGWRYSTAAGDFLRDRRPWPGHLGGPSIRSASRRLKLEFSDGAIPLHRGPGRVSGTSIDEIEKAPRAAYGRCQSECVRA